MLQKVEKKINNREHNNRVLLLLLMFCVIVVSSIINNTVLASLSSAPSIAIDNAQGAFYEVNNDGDTTIRVTGTIIGVSIATCHFQLEIPNSFEVDTLADGSPIMEMLSNGSSLEIIEDGNKFEAMFKLKTYNTTLIPKSYFLEINSSAYRYSGYITPQWLKQESPEQSGGIGASYNPYIEDFYAYDSDKGVNEHVKTWIYNPAPFPKYLSYLKYQIFADDYDDWEDWTPMYSENRYIWDGWTLVVHDYLDYIIDTASNEKYALNIGDNYKVTRVNAYGSGWNNIYYPNSRGEFKVELPSSGTHVVFVAHLVDQAFRNEFDEDDWFDDLETQYYFLGWSWFNLISYPTQIDFKSLVLSWSPSSTDLDMLFEDLSYDATDILGLDTVWISWDGTHQNNHGFDMLFGSVYQTNSGGSEIGYADNPGNKGLAMKGGYSQLLTTMHETLHTYGCDHITWLGFWIMNKWPFGLPGWEMNAITAGTLGNNLDHYDGL